MKKVKRFALLTAVLVVTVLTLFTQFSPGVQAASSSPAGVWKTTSSMYDARSYHTATRLLNGLVLVAGGGDLTPTPSAELFKNG